MTIIEHPDIVVAEPESTILSKPVDGRVCRLGVHDKNNRRAGTCIRVS
jgi:hypothetical protein